MDTGLGWGEISTMFRSENRRAVAQKRPRNEAEGVPRMAKAVDARHRPATEGAWRNRIVDAGGASVTRAVCVSMPANGSHLVASECNDLQQDETEGQELSPLKAAAVAYVLEGARLSAVASSVGVSRTTLWRWSKTPEWREAIAQERELLQTVVRSQLQTLAAEAIHVVDSALRSQDKRLALRAALAVLQGVGALPGRAESDPAYR